MLNEKIEQAIFIHYKNEYPRECCGLIVDNFYYPCENIATSENQFEISSLDYLKASKKGKVRAVVHSHPDDTTEPSMPDRVQMNLHGIPWIITNGESIAVHYPDKYQAPLLGREYHHGVLDCYTIVKDYFHRELGITLNDYARSDGWWEFQENDSLYITNFKKEGFREVNDVKKHDLIITRVGRTYHPNHACIFIGDGELKSEETEPVFGNELILHHPYGRPSIREVYGRQWQARTTHILRHEAL